MARLWSPKTDQPDILAREMPLSPIEAAALDEIAQRVLARPNDQADSIEAQRPAPGIGRSLTRGPRWRGRSSWRSQAS
ncbi:hypothetical protein SE17_06880 [Kouleothrix aurantiaca]|uniref:Uncharacterized protein n=1 Tax=Kouleothrix aurantiaca TaxID=186479 RepID=A0A0P9D7S0_9CHLR|nr:hypothetical protein SE17_06880 [Kouleothrix aurantiaca]